MPRADTASASSSLGVETADQSCELNVTLCQNHDWACEFTPRLHNGASCDRPQCRLVGESAYLTQEEVLRRVKGPLCRWCPGSFWF